MSEQYSLYLVNDDPQYLTEVDAAYKVVMGDDVWDVFNALDISPDLIER
tara:strand:- start:6976 stop:7122 length:147 start_codon:yes stop_codon:yes gene_type:complete